MLRAARTGRLRMTWDEMRARIERQHEIWKRGDLDWVRAMVAQSKENAAKARARPIVAPQEPALAK